MRRNYLPTFVSTYGQIVRLHSQLRHIGWPKIKINIDLSLKYKKESLGSHRSISRACSWKHFKNGPGHCFPRYDWKEDANKLALFLYFLDDVNPVFNTLRWC